jgi:hypothetical protein
MVIIPFAGKVLSRLPLDAVQQHNHLDAPSLDLFQESELLQRIIGRGFAVA